MAKKNNCENCAFGEVTERLRHDVPVIECHRFPPTQNGDQQTPEPYPFPAVAANQWCGEHNKKG